jgi:hypothetical protein
LAIDGTWSAARNGGTGRSRQHARQRRAVGGGFVLTGGNEMKIWVDIASAAFAFGAAILWFLSAMGEMPRNFPISVQSFNVPQHLVIGPFQNGVGHSDELDALGQALRGQSKLSARAAISAGLAALCQAIAVFLPHFS